jgi:hypothetical protein
MSEVVSFTPLPFYPRGNEPLIFTNEQFASFNIYMVSGKELRSFGGSYLFAA